MLRELMSINPYLNNSKYKNNKTKQKLIIKKEIDKTPSPIETPYELICSNQNVSNNKSTTAKGQPQFQKRRQKTKRKTSLLFCTHTSTFSRFSGRFHQQSSTIILPLS